MVGSVHNVQSLLSSGERDYLIRNNGDQVAISSLKGKKLGLYFSSSWSQTCQNVTESLVEIYDELVTEGDFEVVFISGDEDVESFKGYFAKMPWLAVPFTDSGARKALVGCFKVKVVPRLLFLDENGKVWSDRGVGILLYYGAEGYPFTAKRLKEIEEEEEEARRNQSLRSLLESPSRDFIITPNGSKVPVTDLEGKMVGLYFIRFSCEWLSDFTATLVQVYKELKAKDDNFEIVMIPLDDDEEDFKKGLSSVPWFSLPFKDKKREKLSRHFHLGGPPSVVIIGPDGKTLHRNVADAIEEHGANAYPFTPEKFSELEKIEKARREAQTLESVLVSGDLDFVVGKDGVKIPVSDLVGKHILLYFSEQCCGCSEVTPELVEMYHEIKAKHEAFEVIFISGDDDQASYDDHYSTMPWLALPFGDERKQSLSRLFKADGVPWLAVLGPTGKTITSTCATSVTMYGAKGFPFTVERRAEIETEYVEMTKGWPKQVKHELHEEHELVLTRAWLEYMCDGCDKEGKVWSYTCRECCFNLHSECAFKESSNGKAEVIKREGKLKEGWVCVGGVCSKV